MGARTLGRVALSTDRNAKRSAVTDMIGISEWRLPR